jgi:hypothetical protein
MSKHADTFVIWVRPKRGVDPIKALRRALKVLGRCFGLRVVQIEEELSQGRRKLSHVSDGRRDAAKLEGGSARLPSH